MQKRSHVPYRPRQRSLLLAALFLFSTWLAACEQTGVGEAPATTVTIAGSTAMRPLLRELTAEFSARHPNVVFDLRGGGSTLGESWVQDGRIELAASTLLGAEEDEAASTAEQRNAPGTAPDTAPGTASDSSLMRIPLGLDGIAVIAHPSAGVESLTLLELHDLYTGTILDWSALGGGEESVMLVSREAGSGTRQLFETRVMGDEPVSLTSVVMPTSAAVVDFVAENPGAVGYVSRAFVRSLLDGTVDANAPAVRVVAVDGALPTLPTLAEQAYPLPQPLYLVTAGPPTGVVRQFNDFVLSPAGQEIVARYHLPVRQ
jgi:phosphate transport system substrate-binding protein